MAAGEELIQGEHFGAGQVQDRLEEVEGMWQHLNKLSEAR